MLRPCRDTATLAAAFVLAGACGDGTPMTAQEADGSASQTQFMEAFRPYCGKAFAAKIVEDSQPSPAWDHPLVVHVRDCEDSVIRMPLHVGEDRSRTWVLTQHAGYIDFQHIHLHDDGSPDLISPYGGQTRDAGAANLQRFPADDASKALFSANGLDASIPNVWSIGFPDGDTMTYALRRPSRVFQVEVDLSHAVPLPPPAWGYQPGDAD